MHTLTVYKSNQPRRMDFLDEVEPYVVEATDDFEVDETNLEEELSFGITYATAYNFTFVAQITTENIEDEYGNHSIHIRIQGTRVKFAGTVREHTTLLKNRFLYVAETDQFIMLDPSFGDLKMLSFTWLREN